MAKRVPRALSHPEEPSTGESLVDWREPDRNARVLDWRERARDFGLLPVDEHGVVEAPLPDRPVKLLEDGEPEAFEDQSFDDGRLEAIPPEELEERPDAKVPYEDVDLVRVYLKHIGR